MTRHRRLGAGFSLIELLIVVAIIGIIAAIAIPALLRARMAANETGALGDSRTLVAANATYAKSNRGCYATTTLLLNQPNPDIGTLPFADSDIGQLTPYTKNGTQRAYASTPNPGGDCCTRGGAPCDDVGAITWNYVANPTSWGGTANRAFSTDHSGLICEQINAPLSWVANGVGTTPPCGTAGSSPISN